MALPEGSIDLSDLYDEGGYIKPNGDRWEIVGVNEGGYNCTSIDLESLLWRIKERLPDVWAKVNAGQ